MPQKKKNNIPKKKTNGNKPKEDKYDEKIKVNASFEELIKMAAQGYGARKKKDK